MDEPRNPKTPRPPTAPSRHIRGDYDHDLIRRLATTRRRLVGPKTDPSALLLHISEMRHFQLLAPTWISRHYPIREEPLPANPHIVDRERSWNSSNVVEHLTSAELPRTYVDINNSNNNSSNSPRVGSIALSPPKQPQSPKKSNQYRPGSARKAANLADAASPTLPRHRSTKSIMESMTHVAIKHPALIVDTVLREPLRISALPRAATAASTRPNTASSASQRQPPAVLSSSFSSTRPGSATIAQFAASGHGFVTGALGRRVIIDSSSGERVELPPSPMLVAAAEKRRDHRESRYLKLTFAMCCDGFGCPVSLLSPASVHLGIHPEVRPKSARSTASFAATPQRLRAVDPNLIAWFVLQPVPMRGDEGEGAFLIELASPFENIVDGVPQRKLYLTGVETSEPNKNDRREQAAAFPKSNVGRQSPLDDPDLEQHHQLHHQQDQQRRSSAGSSSESRKVSSATSSTTPIHQQQQQQRQRQKSGDQIDVNEERTRRQSCSGKKTYTVVLLPRINAPPRPASATVTNSNNEKQQPQPKRRQRDPRLRQRWLLNPVSGVLPTCPGHAVSAALLDIPLTTLFTSQRYRITPVSNRSLSLLVDPEIGRLTVVACGNATTSLSSAASFLFARNSHCIDDQKNVENQPALSRTSSMLGHRTSSQLAQQQQLHQQRHQSSSAVNVSEHVELHQHNNESESEKDEYEDSEEFDVDEQQPEEPAVVEEKSDNKKSQTPQRADLPLLAPSPGVGSQQNASSPGRIQHENKHEAARTETAPVAVSSDDSSDSDSSVSEL